MNYETINIMIDIKYNFYQNLDGIMKIPDYRKMHPRTVGM